MHGQTILRPPRRSRGFSLAELLVVLVIISLASTMAIVAYSNSRKGASVRSGADKVRAVIVNARTQAIADGRPTQVVFDLTNQQMWIDALDEAGEIRAPKIVAPEMLGFGVVMETVRINTNTFSQGLARAVFTPEGTNPMITVNLRREFDDATVNENYFTVQMYPSSPEPRVWANARR